MLWFYKKFINIGIDRSSSFDKQSRIQLVNQIAFVFIIAAAPYSALFRYMGDPVLAILVVPSVAMFIICILLNYYKKNNLSRIFLLVAIVIPIYFYSGAIGKSSGIHNTLYAFITIPLVIFDRLEYWPKRVGVFLCIGSAILLELTGYNVIYKSTIEEQFYPTIDITIKVVTFFILILTIQFYKKANQLIQRQLKKYNSSIQQSNKELKKAYKELENKKKLDAEYEMARQQQKAFLPTNMPRMKGYIFDSYSPLKTK